jgi:hypothetical protein
MTNALTIRNELTPAQWEMINEIAPVMHASRLFGVSSSAAAAAIMLKGRDLGLSFTGSFDLIHVIDGKPGLSPRGALAILHGSPEIARIGIERLTNAKGDYEGHECTVERRNGFTYTARYTLKDAERAGLNKSGSGWAKYPENMCLWRAVGFAADVAAPDIIGGMKTADQYGAAITAEGDVITGQWSDTEDGFGVTHTDANGPDETAAAALAAQALVEEYSAEAVLAANGGAIPATMEEIDAVRYALIAAEAAGIEEVPQQVAA